METKTFDDLFANARNNDSFWEEKAKIDFVIELNRLLLLRKMNRSEFARKLGCSPPHVTKILSGETNFTIGKMIRLARALDGKLSLHITPAEEGPVNWIRVIEGRKRSNETEFADWGKALAVETQRNGENLSASSSPGEPYERAAYA